MILSGAVILPPVKTMTKKKRKRGTYKDAKQIQNQKIKRELDRVASEEIENELGVDKDK